MCCGTGVSVRGGGFKTLDYIFGRVPVAAIASAFPMP
jgi:hypothetical protein